MRDRDVWNSLYGRMISTRDPGEQGPTEIRPDLVFHPVFMIAVMVHEGTHAIDPALRESTQFAQWFLTATEDHPDYGMNCLLASEMNNTVERNAVQSEIAVLAKLRAPGFLVPAQLNYFNEQQPALLASRTIHNAKLEATAVILELSKSVFKRIEATPSLSMTPVLSETQNLLNYGLCNKNKAITWPEIMLGSLEKIRGDLARFDTMAEGEEIPFDEMRGKLIECKSINDANVWLSSKATLPPLQIISD